MTLPFRGDSRGSHGYLESGGIKMLKKIIDCWDQIEKAIAAVAICVAFLLTFMEVIARFVFSYSSTGPKSTSSLW
jgi:TRAP-type C4-dicarboxylate transport system permease small subunit